MSTKNTHIPEWLTVPFAGITPAPRKKKGQDLIPNRQLALDSSGVSRQVATLQQRLRHQ